MYVHMAITLILPTSLIIAETLVLLVHAAIKIYSLNQDDTQTQAENQKWTTEI